MMSKQLLRILLSMLSTSKSPQNRSDLMAIRLFIKQFCEALLTGKYYIVDMFVILSVKYE